MVYSTIVDAKNAS